MAKKIGVKNINFTFLPFVKAHLEYFKDGRKILVKLKNGDWDIVWHYATNSCTGKALFQSIDSETVWSEDNIDYWAFLPKEI